MSKPKGEVVRVSYAVVAHMGGWYVDFSIFSGMVSSKYMSLVPPLYISQSIFINISNQTFYFLLKGMQNLTGE